MTGYDDGSNLFGTNDTITREQMCKVVFGCSYSNLADASREKYDKLLGTEQTSDWAEPYVIWAVDRGVINGIDNLPRPARRAYPLPSRAGFRKLHQRWNHVG